MKTITSSLGTSFAVGKSATFSTTASDNEELDRIELYVDGSKVKTSYTTSISYSTSTSSELLAKFYRFYFFT